jgi:hypothetical protein
MKSVKLNFHLKLNAIVVSNRGLHVELQVFCALALHKRYKAVVELSHGLELIRHTQRPFMSLLESTQLR